MSFATQHTRIVIVQPTASAHLNKLSDLKVESLTFALPRACLRHLNTRQGCSYSRPVGLYLMGVLHV